MTIGVRKQLQSETHYRQSVDETIAVGRGNYPHHMNGYVNL